MGSLATLRMRLEVLSLNRRRILQSSNLLFQNQTRPGRQASGDSRSAEATLSWRGGQYLSVNGLMLALECAKRVAVLRGPIHRADTAQRERCTASAQQRKLNRSRPKESSSDTGEIARQEG